MNQEQLTEEFRQRHSRYPSALEALEDERGMMYCFMPNYGWHNTGITRKEAEKGFRKEVASSLSMIEEWAISDRLEQKSDCNL